jgi:RHS repeat-associated protein
VGGLLKVTDYVGGTTHHFVAYDGNGNVAALADGSSGALTARYEYGPFGEGIRITGPGTTPMAEKNPFRFSTKYTDDQSGILYYGYRYLNPSTGRWLSRDPLEEKGGKNLYEFALNNPSGHWDPDGRVVSRARGDKECEDACNEVAAQLWRENGGGACVCIHQKKCPCIWEANFVMPHECDQIDKCGLDHEEGHCSSPNAQCDYCGGPARPIDPAPGTDPSVLGSEECRLRREELKCLKDIDVSKLTGYCPQYLKSAIERTQNSLKGCP